MKKSLSKGTKVSPESSLPAISYYSNDVKNSSSSALGFGEHKGEKKSVFRRVVEWIKNFLLSIRLLLVVFLVVIVLVVLMLTWFIGNDSGTSAVSSLNRKLKNEFLGDLKLYLYSQFSPHVKLLEIYKNLMISNNYNFYSPIDRAHMYKDMYSSLKGIDCISFSGLGDNTGYNAVGAQNVYDFGNGQDPGVYELVGHDAKFYTYNVSGQNFIPSLTLYADNTNTDYWRQMNVSNPKPTWSAISVNTLSETEPLFFIAYATPIWRKKEFYYAWSSILFGSMLNQYLITKPFTKNSITLLLDADTGYIIGTSSNLAPSFMKTSAGFVRTTPLNANATFVADGYRALLKNYPVLKNINESISITTTSGGSLIDVDMDSYTYSKDVGGMNWKILLFTPQDDVLGDINIRFRNGLIISLSIMVFGAVLVFSFGLLITFPLKSLEKEIDNIARLEFSKIKTKKSRSILTEVSAIQKSVDRMKFGLRSFNKYVPSTLVKALLESSTEATLGVGEIEVTIMFTDIENFTTICEALDPQAMVNQLCEYLERTTSCIVRNEGTVDKFIGDAIMAFWNAPFPVENHAYKACKAGMEMIAALDSLFEMWSKRNSPLLKTRIGIHTGRALIGNVGTYDRMNYTALGDSVNIASRLEGINKNYGTYICVSSATYACVKDKLFCTPMDSVNVKGKTVAVNIYEVISFNEIVPEQEKLVSSLYQEALDHYERKSYDECLGFIRKIESQDERAYRIKPLKEKCLEILRNN
ncbi:hypothetical protein ABK040_002985 [Willaertia magna]